MSGTFTVTKTLAITRIINVTITENTLAVDLEDGWSIAVPIGWFPRLGAGYGIHWPDLDEDIGVKGLLLGKKSTESPVSFARWFDKHQQNHSTMHTLT